MQLQVEIPDKYKSTLEFLESIQNKPIQEILLEELIDYLESFRSETLAIQ